jgi:hypothetical protein
MKPVLLFIALAVTVSPGTYSWKQAMPPGTGCFQEECIEGQWPLAIAPVKAFGEKLWMVGQKKVWSSTDGVKWSGQTKADWEERISFPTVYFKDQMLMMGGLIYQTRTMANDIWTSEDGSKWMKVKDHAEWSPRKGHELIEFNNKLWLIGGASAVDEFRAGKDFLNDVWVSDYGLTWTLVTSDSGLPAVDNPNVVVFQNKMWLIGGGGIAHTWNSADGKNWTKVVEQPEWAPRWDYGILVFDDKLWVFGGREADPRKAYNDLWHSADGIHWFSQDEHAPWTPRSGGHSIVFKDRLWIFSGKHTGSTHNWNKDIWVMQRDQ